MAKNAKLPGWPDMLQPPFAGLGAGFAQSDGSSAAAPGLAGGMDFMKSLWGKLPSAVPGFVLPTLDIDELDKRIEDLRSVESWLSLNANMLKATIQGLEVQRNTLAALQALREKGDLLSAMMKPATGATALSQHAANEHESQQHETPASSPEQAKSRAAFADAFRHSFGASAGNPNWPLPLEPADAPAEVSDDEPPPDNPPVQKIKKSTRKKTHKARAKVSGKHNAATNAGALSSGAAQSANLWMNFLKDQFSQIANAASVVPGAAPSKVSTAKPAAKKKAAASPARRAAKAASKRGNSARTGMARKTTARRPAPPRKG